MLEEYVHTLLRADAIEETRFIKFQGRLFSVPKRDTPERRVILDLSALNKFIVCPHFKMTSVEQVRRIIPQGSWMVSLDLKDAYLHVPVARAFRKFLGFRIGSRAYQFKSLPFGLNIAPLVFTKLTRMVQQELRLKGIQLAAYLDDWLIWGPTEGACIHARDSVLRKLQNMGFLINWAKSCLVPSQRIEWLGIGWNTQTARLSMPVRKRREIRSSIKTFLSSGSMSRRSLERVLGKIQHATIIDPLGKTILKFLNHYGLSFAQKGLRDRSLPIAGNLRKSLRRWLDPSVLRMTQLFTPPLPSVDVYTDASLTGWGVHTSDRRELQGVWSQLFRGFHINILELITVWLALRRLHFKKGTHVRVHCDNTTVISCLNRRGSARSPALNSWTLSVGKVLHRKGLFLSAFHIAGIRNVIADALSRNSTLQSEWSLDRGSFEWLAALTEHPQVDMFATQENTQLQCYISPIRDPQAAGMNAFLQDWNQWNSVYLFPPWSQILKVLEKMKSFKGHAILVTPFWPNQAWFPMCQNLFPRNVRIPEPTLTQRVGQDIFCRSSSPPLHLHAWIS